MTTRHSEQLRIGSMFSGSGGLDLAVESVLHATPAWFCEWDEAPAKVLARHWPEVPNHRDVTSIDWEEMGRKPDLAGTYRLHAAEGGDANDNHRIDILTGGYP